MEIFKRQTSFINGKYLSSSSNRNVVNTLYPATGEILCELEEANLEDIAFAVESAEKGFKTWSKMKGADRGRILLRAAHLLRESVQSLAEIEVFDTGKPISEAVSVDIPSAAEAIEYFAGLAATLHGEHFDLGKSFVYTRREPIGICAGIGAWNYPLQIASWKAAPALACGNAMIFKPSELTPLTALKLAEIFTEAGLPDGVFNVIIGGREVGKELVRNKKISKVSITGSVPSGKAIMADSAATLKKVTLELGGKSPLIVFDDANIEDAVSAALLANFYTQGEVCSNGTRVFIHESIQKVFIEKLLERTRKLKIGDPMDMATHVGSLISRDHLEKVMRYVKLGKEEGAKLLCGGEIPRWEEKDAKFKNGAFIEPTIFTECDDKMTIVKEEIFGPVMSVLSFKNEEEVIERANDTEFGLSAGVFTEDIKRAHRVIAEMQAGTCWINNYNITPIEAPFGGYKNSGIGRENSLAAIEHYTQLKSVYVEMGGVDCPYP
jgi:betaine-aldehyde dehydrogenase